MSCFLARALPALLLVVTAAPAVASDADGHLRAGAALFRAGRFAEAVVEFKVARKLGANSECPWYVAAALTRAGRSLDALEAFDEAAELAPESADGLFLYYRAVACSETQLVVCAAESFELASKASGPKVAAEAERLALDARKLLAGEPPKSAIDALLSRASQQLRDGHPRLARVLAREAGALAARRGDRFRGADALRFSDAGAHPP